jgi:hypothetical protein
MSKVNRKQTSSFVRTSNSPKNDIKQSLLYLYGKTNCTKISNLFFSFRIHPCPQFFCLKGFRLVLYVREKKRAQIISFFFFFLSIDVCCQTSYRITPPLCHSDDFNQLFFFCAFVCCACMLREFVCSAGRLISRPPLLLFTFSAPFFRFKPFYQARVQAVDVKNADARIKNTENGYQQRRSTSRKLYHS